MPIINMVSYQVTEFSFKNNLPNGTKVSLQTKYSYNVKFAEGNHCRGEIIAEVTDRDNNEGFFVKTVVAALFNFKADAQKPIIHVETFKALFPYAKSFVAMCTAASGVPPITLPEIDIESQNIYSFEKPHPDHPAN